MAKQAGAALFIGVDTLAARADGFRHYNSAAFVRPDVGLSGRRPDRFAVRDDNEAGRRQPLLGHGHS